MGKNCLRGRSGRGNFFSVVQSKRGKTSLKCPPTCVRDTRGYSKATCEPSLRDRTGISETAPTPKTQMTMTMMMMMQKTPNCRRSKYPSNHLPEGSFQIQSHFDRQRRNSAEHLNLV